MVEPKIGLTSSSIPKEVIEKFQTEDDLTAALNTSSEVPAQSTVPITFGSDADGLEPVNFHHGSQCQAALGTPSEPDMGWGTGLLIIF